MNEHEEERQSNIVRSFQSMFGKEELLEKIVELFPYPIQVAAPDGVLILMNEAFLRTFKVPDKDLVIGKYNLLNDIFIENGGLKEYVSRAFRGETIKLSDIKVPIPDILKMFGEKELEPDSLFLNITSFPIFNEHHQLSCVVSVFITSRLYHGKEEIIKGKEYIESHWQEKFDIDAAANASGLSKTHFMRLFKKHTGFTPHDYYVGIKINMIKEKLLDTNLSISQVFSECGVDYNGHYARIFKDQVGATLSEYRRNNS
jgi:AraC-like DNA-binding protein